MAKGAWPGEGGLWGETICRLCFEKCMSQSKWKKFNEQGKHKSNTKNNKLNRTKGSNVVVRQRRIDLARKREGERESRRSAGNSFSFPLPPLFLPTKYCGLLLGAI